MIGGLKHARLNKSPKKLLLLENGKKCCSKCASVKTLSSFCRSKKTSDGRSSWCRQCSTLRMMESRRKPKNVYKALIKKEPDSDITFSDFIDIIAEPCFYCGEPNETLGIDRVIPGKDGGKYTKENSVSCCADCNRLKMGRSFEYFIKKIKTIYANLHLDKIR